MTTSTVEKDIGALKEDFAALRRDVEKLIASLSKSGSKAAMNSVRGAADTAQRQAKESVESVGQHVKERPISSVLIAMGVGFILAKLLDR